MSTTIDAAAVPRTLVRSSAAIRTAERRFFLTFSVALAVAVFVGFARTFFLRAWYPAWAAANAAPESIFILHGTLFAAWYLLLPVQASLIAVRRVAWHRRLGFASLGLAGGMVVLGTFGALVAARRPTGFVNVPLPPLQFLIVPIAAMVLYAVFVTLAVVARRDPQAHKRYMLLASIVMIEAAVARWPFAFMNGSSPVPFLDMPSLVTDLFLVPLVVWDFWARGRMHPVTLIGGATMVLTHALRMPIASTAGWQALAGWAVF